MTPSPAAVPQDSIDAFIAMRLPAWLSTAHSDQLKALALALKRQQGHAHALAQVLEGILPLDAFATPLLEQALRDAGLGQVDVQTWRLQLKERLQQPTAAPNLPSPWIEETTTISLLGAALHNFPQSDTEVQFLKTGKLLDDQKRVHALSYPGFAQLCRSLDLGGRYQTLLNACLRPDDEPGTARGSAARAVEKLFEDKLRSDLDVALRTAVLKGEIDEATHLLMLPLTAEPAVVPAYPQVLSLRQLYLLGKRIHSVVLVEVGEPAGAQGMIAWIPGDPHGALQRHASWQALAQALGARFCQAGYPTFFARFIGEQDRPAFFTVLGRLLADRDKAATGVELDARRFPLPEPLFGILAGRQVQRMLDDARVLAVPTGDEDSAARRLRLQAYENAGLDVLGLVGMFVPVVGVLMLGVSAVEIANEVYEGYEDWQIGDRQAAIGHLLGVAQSLALNAAMVGAGTAVGHVLDRVGWVDGLVPVPVQGGRLKLCSSDLRPYQVEGPDIGPGLQVQVADRTRVRLPEGVYEVRESQLDGQMRIVHPERADAHSPVLEHNGASGWRHALEQPHHWEGRQVLLQRLGGRFRDISDIQARDLMRVCGIDEANVRRIHLENAPAPARWVDAMERLQLHQQFPRVQGPAFDELLALRQIAGQAEDNLLIKDFPGLTPRCAREIIERASGAQINDLRSRQRVPLALAEQARWSLRESRLDRACCGLSLPQATGVDTLKVALGLLDGLFTWPTGSGLEVRQSGLRGQVLARCGAASGGDIRVIVMGRGGYLAHEASGSLAVNARSHDSLVQAVLHCLDGDQKQLSGGAELTVDGLAEYLANAAASDRSRAARLMGLSSRGDSVRPPLRQGDGRLGYPLSGHGEGSRQAFRRALRQVFPTLTDAQLEAYILDLMHRQVGLWNHLTQLHTRLQSLREALHAWQGQRTDLLDGYRRQRVANRIRRCWRRKTAGLAGDDYVLHIEGERVGHLPELPASIDFGHVTRLTLRNMDLAIIDQAFLRRFANITELDLRHNRLVGIPRGIEDLTHLRRLNLADNQIVMDDQGSQRLQALTQLRQLDLSGNPLGRAPVLGALLHLQELSLRNAGLEALPPTAGLLPRPAITDMRDNQIRQLNHDLQALRQRMQRLALHDNPLDEGSEALLSEAAGTSTGRSTAVRHDNAAARTREIWLAGVTQEERFERERMWDRLAEEEGSRDFLRFLGDFGRTDDFNDHPGYFRSRVWRLIDLCVENSEERQLLFQQAGGPRTCEDRMLLVLSQLETRALLFRAMQVAPAQAEASLLRLGRSLYRLDQVDAFAARHLQQMRQNPFQHIDDVEVYLAYRVNLAQPLDLPAQPYHMHYEAFSGVSSAQINQARGAILHGESNEALSASLAQREFWDEYLRKRYAARFEDLAAPFHERLEALEEQAREGNEQAYLEGAAQLMSELQSAEQALVLTLTREAYARLAGT